MTTENQTTRILRHMKKGYAVTPLDALHRFGCFRLGARIWELRRDGYRINKQIVKRNGKHWARYVMARSA
jgi:hypothetical protein